MDDYNMYPQIGSIGIRQGDHIRVEYTNHQYGMLAKEYIAQWDRHTDHQIAYAQSATHYLIKRPAKKPLFGETGAFEVWRHNVHGQQFIYSERDETILFSVCGGMFVVAGMNVEEVQRNMEAQEDWVRDYPRP